MPLLGKPGDLAAAASSGTCAGGTFKGSVNGDAAPTFAGACAITGDVTLGSNAETMALLKHVQIVSGAVTVGGSTDFADAMPDLTSAGSIGMGSYSNTVLTGPAKLKTVGTLNIANPKIEAVAGFGALTTAQSISIANNAALLSVVGFGAMAKTASITVQNNPKLNVLSAFAALKSVDDLKIAGDNALPTISDFPALTTVTNSLEISGLGALVKLGGFPALTSAKILKITGMASMASLSFPQLATVESFTLDGVLALHTPEGFPKMNVKSAMLLCTMGMTCKQWLDWGHQLAPGIKDTAWAHCSAGFCVN